MNIYLLHNTQAVVFRIIFILFGIYIILAILREIILLFYAPSKTDKNNEVQITYDINDEAEIKHNKKINKILDKLEYNLEDINQKLLKIKSKSKKIKIKNKNKKYD